MRRDVETGIIPECYVDTNLTETLTGFVCNHQKGCANVAKQMQEKRSDQFALGIIDKDKRPVRYLSEFELIARNDYLEVHKHKSRPHYIIYIIPAVEGFVLKAAEEVGVSLSDFCLPNDLESLKRQTKQQDSKKDVRFKKLFMAIKESSAMRVLQEIVVYLKENQYTAEVEIIKSSLMDK